MVELKIYIADTEQEVKNLKLDLQSIADKEYTSESSDVLHAKLASLEGERSHFEHTLQAERSKSSQPKFSDDPSQDIL